VARHQYRLAGAFDWQSNSGAALVALVNKAGSGKKITIRSLELQNLTAILGQDTILALGRPTVGVTGIEVDLTPSDSDAVWPSTVRVFGQGYVDGAPTVPIRRVYAAKQAAGAGTLAWFARHASAERMGLFGSHRSARSTTVESIVVREGESVALYKTNPTGRSQPVYVTATVTIAGTPNRTWSGNWFTQVQGDNSHIFAVQNDAGSGEVVTVQTVAFYEAGTFDSPYFQAVPIGALVLDNPLDSQAITAEPVDSTSPAAATSIDCFQNVALRPFGLPENAFSEASTGTPKGFNYLKSKDFNGPAWRATFPEQAAFQVTLNDGLGYGMNNHRNADIGFRRAGVVLRENEGLALVSAAETAIVTTAVGVSGTSTWHLNIIFDIEPSFEPTLTISGLRNPSEVRIFDAGTTTELAGEENITDGEFTWVFDPTLYPDVDIAVLSLGYQNIRFTNFPLTLADTTIPVQQQIDRQYENV
jgi:hypothetical protein